MSLAKLQPFCLGLNVLTFTLVDQIYFSRLSALHYHHAFRRGIFSGGRIRHIPVWHMCSDAAWCVLWHGSHRPELCGLRHGTLVSANGKAGRNALQVRIFSMFNFVKTIMVPEKLRLRITGPLWGEFTGDRWIPLTEGSVMQKASLSWREVKALGLISVVLNCWPRAGNSL